MRTTVVAAAICALLTLPLLADEETIYLDVDTGIGPVTLADLEAYAAQFNGVADPAGAFIAGLDDEFGGAVTTVSWSEVEDEGDYEKVASTWGKIKALFR